MSNEYQPLLAFPNQHLLAIPRGGKPQVIPITKISDFRQQLMKRFVKLFETFQSAGEEYKAPAPGQRWNLYLTGETAVGGFVISPKTDNDWGYSTVTCEAERELSLENERLKTQLMAEKRTVLQERRRYSDLSEQNEKLWEYVSELREQNKTLVRAVVGRVDEKLCFSESHKGTVTEVREGEITVSYTTQDGDCITQVYKDSQFVKHRVPNAGDTIEAHVIVATAPRTDPERLDDASLDKAFRGFVKGKTGRHTL